MDQNSSYSPSVGLPSPGSDSGSGGAAAGQPLQQGSPASGVASTTASGVPLNAPMIPPVSPQADVPGASPQSAAPRPPAAPHRAADADLIEKAWVEKAKAIVARTRQDPYAQSRELSKFKADYIKKRYNREVKLAEE